MWKNLTIASLFALGFAGAVSAGPYVSGDVAAVSGFNSDVRGTLATAFGPVTGNAEAEFKTGWSGAVAGGYEFDTTDVMGFGLGFRGEIEASIRSLGLDAIQIDNVAFGGGPSIGGLPVFDLRGHVRTLAFMANAAVDLENETAFTPYLLVGFGGARSTLEVDRFAGFSVNAKDRDWGYAFQGGAGIAFAVTETFEVTLNYRFFQIVEDPRLTFGTPGGPVFADAELRNHSLGLGGRLTF